MKHNYTRTISILFLLVFFNLNVIGQTNPVAQSLPYSQNFNGLASNASAYLAGWQGWNLSTAGSSTSFRTNAPIADLPLIPSSTAANSSKGVHNYAGKIGILDSATLVDASLCLSIITSGVNTVLVNYDVMTIRNPFVTGVNTRVNGVDLQYRVGTSGVFTSVTGLANGNYQNNSINQTTAVTTPQNSSAKSLTLPAACNNQPVVQLRWVQRDISGIGERPSFAVDNIVICTSVVTPTISISGPSAFCTGNSATYTATITNGGSTPVYQWKKNTIVVGTNSPTLTQTSLVVTDKIDCSLTSNATCVTSTTVASNQIIIGVVNSSPSITSAVITPASCPGVRNGAINITVSGGTAPYTICWDTSNISTGLIFAVTVGVKTSSNPYFGQGIGATYYLNTIEAKELFLTKDFTYSFNPMTPGHPFHITTSSVGGSTAGLVTNGQSSNAPAVSGTITFTPNNSHPSLLYYQCSVHQFMGWKVNIVNGYCVEDPVNLKPGIYNVIVTDANGCTTTAQYTVNEQPTPIQLSTSISDATCGNTNGAIDLSVSNGTSPYTVCWDTANTESGLEFGVTVGAKTSSHPYFNLGTSVAFYINTIEAKILSLTRGFTYTFNIMNAGHPWHISTDSVGGNSANIVLSGQTGAPDDVGTVTFTPNNTHPSLLRYDCSVHQYMGYRINILDAYCVEDLSSLNPGIYTVRVTDAIGCSATATYTINESGNTPQVTLKSSTDASCFGAADGQIDLDPSLGSPPYFAAGTGPTFGVIVETKNHSHPQYGVGSSLGFSINGVQGKELTLVRGITYSFSVLAGPHTFYISTNVIGGPSNTGEVTDGVINSMVSNGTLYFTPKISHPSLLYYQCGLHDNMGWKINIVDQLPDGDLDQCMAGNYELFITDADGCNSNPPLSVTISEPAPNTFYYDGDLDQYGSSNEQALACSPPAGFISIDGDCDDESNLVNPGAVEICNGIDDDCDNLTDEGCGATLTINRLFIQGYYDMSGLMRPVLLNENVPNATIYQTDSLIVELHPDTDLTFVSARMQTVLQTDGTALCNIPSNLLSSTGNYFIVVKHRGSIEVWSSITLSIDLNMVYDFSTSSTSAFGGNLIEVGPNIWAVFNGDLDQDGYILNADYTLFEIDNYNQIGPDYVNTDLDGDGYVLNVDYSLFELNNYNQVGKITP